MFNLSDVITIMRKGARIKVNEAMRLYDLEVIMEDYGCTRKEALESFWLECCYVIGCDDRLVQKEMSAMSEEELLSLYLNM